MVYGETLPLGRLNPHASIMRNGPTDRVLSMLYEPLFRFNFNNDGSDEAWESVLATRYEVVPARRGRMAVAVDLRPNVVWHDGAAFTAQDVAFTYNYIRRTGANQQQSEFFRSAITDIRIENPHRVVFELAQPVPDPRILLMEWIIPSSKFTADLAPVSDAANLDRLPVGTGAFRFERFGSTGQPVLVVNERHHAGRGGLDRIEARRYTDQVTLIETLMARQLNLVVEVPPEILRRIEGEGGRFQVRQVQSFNVLAVALRQRPGSPLNNEQVRRAMTMAVDREQLLRNWFGGAGSVLSSPVVPTAPFYDQSVRPLPHDVARARQMISQAGASNARLRFVYPRAEHGLETRVHDAVTSIAEALRGVGLRVDLVPLEQRQFEETIFRRGDFDLAWVRWEFNPAYDITPIFHSAYRGAGGMNYMQFEDAQVDRLLRDYQNATDPGRRRGLMFELQRILNQKAPAIFLLNEQRSYAYDSRYVIPPDLVDPFYFFTYAGGWSVLGR
jgi:peptide/nickel transport system substrate-binding protein